MFGNEKPSAPGYLLTALDYVDPKGRSRELELLLPTQRASALQEERKRAAESALALLQAQEAAYKASLSVDEAPAASWVKPKPKETDLEIEKAELSAKNDEADDVAGGKLVKIYDWDEPLKLISSTRTHDREVAARYKGIFAKLKTLGNRRLIPQPNANGTLKDLLEQHPNFRDVISLVRNALSLSIFRGEPLRIPPILLSGPPGTGKTHFSQSLADWLGTTVHRVSFDSATSSSALLGSDKHWGNSTTGAVFEAVCMAKQANPIMLLDEVDKAREGATYQSPLAALHSLLEPLTSSCVKDISLDFAFDASHITFIATCNQPLVLDASLRSRFTQFQIEAPTGADAYQLAKVMVRKVHAALAISGFMEPSIQFSKLVAHLTPREMRQSLEYAFASAVADGRLALEKHDLPPDVLLDEQEAKREPSKRSGKSDEPSGWIH